MTFCNPLKLWLNTFKNNPISFIIGVISYSLFMLMLWLREFVSGVNIEPFSTIALAWSGPVTGNLSMYDLLNYPFGGNGLIPLPVNFSIWILWGGLLGVGVKRFIYLVYLWIVSKSHKIYLSEKNRVKTEKFPGTCFDKYLKCGIYGCIIGCCGSVAVNLSFFVVMWCYVMVFRENLTYEFIAGNFRYWLILIYFVCAIISGVFYGTFNYVFYIKTEEYERLKMSHTESPEER